MRKTMACLLALIALPFWVAGAAETQVVLVLDSSTSMWRPLDDGVCRFSAARLAIESLALDLAPPEGVQIALRLVGSDVRYTDDAACDDTRLAFPPGVTVQRAAAHALDQVKPTGARPLILATVEAVADLSNIAGRHRIVVVTSGDDSCSGNPRTAAEALGSGTEIRIVGAGLPESIEKRFTAVAPTRNATTTGGLAAALRWAVFGPNPPAKRHTVAITFVGEESPDVAKSVVLADPITGDSFEMKARDRRFEARVPGGIYNATITRESSSVDDYGHIAVSGTSSNEYRLVIPPRPPVTLEVLPDPISAGGDITVHFWGAPEGNHWVEVGRSGHPLGLWTDRAPALGPTGEVVLLAPVDEGTAEVRYLQRLQEGIVRLLGRVPVVIEAPRVSLDVPESVILGSEFSIDWQGPDDQGDHLVIARPQDELAARGACAFTSRGNPLVLRAPPEEGSYAVHYVSGLTASTLATAKFRVTNTPVQLHAPERTPIGRDIVVEWVGPARVGDSVTLAAPDTPGGEYLALHPTGGGSPAVFTAPRQPGTYEIRYVKNIDASVEGSTTIEVYDLQVSLAAPARVKAGTRFEVTWDGPDGAGDFISVAPRGSPWKRKLDWAYTAAGNPASLAVPFSSGVYEVRYISGLDSKILEVVTIKVE